jgi:hypothetical protein
VEKWVVGLVLLSCGRLIRDGDGRMGCSGSMLSVM